MHNRYRPIELAEIECLPIDQFIDNWLEHHGVTNFSQSIAIRHAIEQEGWEFFTDEIIDYCKRNKRYTVYANGSISVNKVD